MQAIQYTAFGPSDVIQLADEPQPEAINENDVLIQVKAAAVNPLDIKIRMGYMQQMFPVELPWTPGLEVAGVVVGVGSNVSRFQVGNEVMAVPMQHGYAEMIAVNEAFVSPKPENLTFAEAAATAVNLGTAQSVLFDNGQLGEGQTVFIQGAAGSVGATMVQLAKNRGLRVIATASGEGIPLVKALGADQVIDYKNEDIAGIGKVADLVADCAGGPSQDTLFAVIKPGGKLLSIAVPPSQDAAAQNQVDARFISSNLSADTIAPLLDLVKTGKIKPIVSKTFPLAEAAAAQDYLSAGGVNGKVVLLVD